MSKTSVMNLCYFHLLNKEKQQDIVLREGIYLAERSEGFFSIMLYQVAGFYVEVYFLNKHNKVALFKAFNDIEFLEPYLEVINISNLLQEVFTEK